MTTHSEDPPRKGQTPADQTQKGDAKKSDREFPPFEPSLSDTGAGSQNRPLQQNTLNERLAYWDEWNGRDQARLGSDSVVGPRLRHIQAAESWLTESLLSKQECPSAEELFAIGGPDDASLWLNADRQEEVREHMRICTSCEAEVLTLNSRPPAPLLDIPLEAPRDASPLRPLEASSQAEVQAPAIAEFVPEGIPEGMPEGMPEEMHAESTPDLPAESSTTLPSVLPVTAEESTSNVIQAGSRFSDEKLFYGLRKFLMVAAALMLVWIMSGRPGLTFAQEPGNQTAQNQAAQWPSWQVVRSAPQGSTLHPSGKLLANAEQRTWQGPLALQSPTASAPELYRVRVLTHSGGAFDQGSLLTTWESDAPSFIASTPLDSGNYTLEYFAVLAGVEHPIGSTEIQIHQDPATHKALEQKQGVGRVELLHAQGYLEAARRAALALPSGPERDAYLEGFAR